MSKKIKCNRFFFNLMEATGLKKSVLFFTSSATNLFSLSERFEFQAGQFSIVLLKYEGLVWLENLYIQII